MMMFGMGGSNSSGGGGGGDPALHEALGRAQRQYQRDYHGRFAGTEDEQHDQFLNTVAGHYAMTKQGAAEDEYGVHATPHGATVYYR